MPAYTDIAESTRMYSMPARVLSLAISVAIGSLCVGGVATAQEGNGRIDGRLIRKNGKGVAGASVVVNETAATDITGANGQFSFANLVPGTYSLTLVLGNNLVTISGVRVEPIDSRSPLPTTVTRSPRDTWV
ncbi:MAG: carboxypeptidase-like regulatory domain-containing protein [Vicinamibacterales bacterium]